MAVAARSRPRGRARLTVCLALLGIAAAGGWYVYVHRAEAKPSYRLAKLERGPLIASVSATGALNAVTTVQVGSQVSGQIKELLVDFNSPVRQGDRLARIDPQTFEARVSQARADLEAGRLTALTQSAQVERAQADLDNAKAAHAEARAQTAKARATLADAQRDLGRKSELWDKRLIAKSDHDATQLAFDVALAQLDSAAAKEQSFAAGIRSADAQLRVAERTSEASQATVRQKEAVLRQAVIDFEFTTIRSPIDGIVVSRAVDVGQTVAASLQAPVLFLIAQDLAKMQVETNVDEADVAGVPLGGKATFTVDALPRETFDGDVVQVRKAPQTVQNVVTYVVVVAVDNVSGRLLPGMTATVRLTVAERPNVLKIPNAALRFRPSGTEADVPDARRASTRPQAAAVPAGTSLRDRIVQVLRLNEQQRQKLDLVFEQARQKRRGLRGSSLPPREMELANHRIREEARARIREFLTAEQREIYDQESGTAARAAPGQVWGLGTDGKPRRLAVAIGITDGVSTEVTGSTLTEQSEVIIGLNEPGESPGPTRSPRLRP